MLNYVQITNFLVVLTQEITIILQLHNKKVLKITIKTLIHPESKIFQ